MKQHKNNLFRSFFLGFLFSCIGVCCILFLLGLLVKQNDFRGMLLSVFLYAAALPGCFFYAFFVQKRTKLRGILCGCLCGLIFSCAYAFTVAAVNSFSVQPVFFITIPVGTLIGCVGGILSANLGRH